MIHIKNIRSLLKLMEDMNITSISPESVTPTLLEIQMLDEPEMDYEFNYDIIYPIG